MSQIAALKCPNCGGLAARNTMKCEYCGAELLVLSDGSSFGFKNQSECPQCGARIEASSWFCPSCSKVLTSNVEMLRRLQKKFKFGQENMRQEYSKKIPAHLIKPLENDECFYFTLSREQGQNFFGLTNNRLIKFKDGEYSEIPLSEIVEVLPVSAKANTSVVNLFLPIPAKITLQFEVATYQGVQKIDGIQGNPAYCGMFWGAIALAVADYEQGKTNIILKLLKLPLE
jgi:predicted RNA-binding Zn-ribbon protein involved in translation (DUF1610 family)